MSFPRPSQWPNINTVPEIIKAVIKAKKKKLRFIKVQRISYKSFTHGSNHKKIRFVNILCTQKAHLVPATINVLKFKSSDPQISSNARSTQRTYTNRLLDSTSKFLIRAGPQQYTKICIFLMGYLCCLSTEHTLIYSLELFLQTMSTPFSSTSLLP